MNAMDRDGRKPKLNTADSFNSTYFPESIQDLTKALEKHRVKISSIDNQRKEEIRERAKLPGKEKKNQQDKDRIKQLIDEIAELQAELAHLERAVRNLERKLRPTIPSTPAGAPTTGPFPEGFGGDGGEGID
jgi:transposase